jgi:hypothetical protein
MTTDTKYLCYLDILGFKNRIAEEQFRKAYDYIIKEVIEPYDYSDKVYLISDSIVLLSDNFTEIVDNSFSIYSIALNQKILLRGAITRGKVNSPAPVEERGNKVVIPFLGEAYLKAYTLEQNMNCAGICIDNEAWKNIKDEEKDLFFSYTELFPKDGNRGEMLFLVSDMKGNWAVPQTILLNIAEQIPDLNPENLTKLIDTFCLYYRVMTEKHNDASNLNKYHEWWINILKKLKQMHNKSVHTDAG